MEMKRGLGLVWGGLAVILALGAGLMLGHKLGHSFGDFEVMRDMEPVLADNAKRITEMGDMIAVLQAQVAHAQRMLSETGEASWYGPGFHGRTAADGSRYDQRSMTAAHKTLPFGTRVMVTSLDTLRSIVVRITDRGPFIEGRIIDLTEKGAELLGMREDGTHRVMITPLLGLDDEASED